jgi:hypothetical protein
MHTIATGAETRTIHVRLEDAAEVYLLGKFNNWSTLATPMNHVGDWLWEATVPAGVEAGDVGFFVWEWGRRFGRFLRYDQTERAASGV